MRRDPKEHSLRTLIGSQRLAAVVVALTILVALLSTNAHAYPLLEFDFENFASGQIIGGPSLAAPALGGTHDMANNGAMVFGPPIGTASVTRFAGAVNFPELTFVTMSPVAFDSIEFTHEHNHNPGFPTFPDYNVDLEIDTGSGYTLLATFLAEIDGGFKLESFAGPGLLSPGAYSLRWIPQVIPDTNTEFFALDDIRLLGSVGPASALIDFQSLEHVDAINLLEGTSYEEDGFTLDGGQFRTFGTLEPRYSGSTALLENSSGAENMLTRTDGARFDIASIDIAELNGNQTPGAIIAFTGDRPDGGTVSQSFQLDGVAFGPETFAFSPEFRDLTAVRWNQDSPFHQFDNIVAQKRIWPIIDFQSLEHVDAINLPEGTSYEEDGFTLDSAAFGTFGTLEPRYSGSTALFEDAGAETVLSRTDGTLFDVFSIDIAELNANQTPGAIIAFTGDLPGGGTVSQSFQLDGVAFGAETFIFSGDFRQLTGLRWNQVSPFHQFDNIVAAESRFEVGIDFEALEHVDAAIVANGPSYAEDGYLVTGPASLSTFGTLSPNFTGSTAMFSNTVGGEATVSHSTGTVFQVVSIDLAELNGNQTPGATVAFAGDLPGGGTVSQSFQIDGAAFGAETFYFSSDFEEVNALRWTQDSPFHQFDNIIVVPEPSSTLQVLGGMVGLIAANAARRRRERKRKGYRGRQE